jgi:hypothetical protein
MSFNPIPSLSGSNPYVVAAKYIFVMYALIAALALPFVSYKGFVLLSENHKLLQETKKRIEDDNRILTEKYDQLSSRYQSSITQLGEIGVRVTSVSTELRNRTDRLSNDLRRAKQNDPKVREWADTRIPDTIIGGLCNTGAISDESYNTLCGSPKSDNGLRGTEVRGADK